VAAGAARGAILDQGRRLHKASFRYDARRWSDQRYYFSYVQATGMVNNHARDGFRYQAPV
jgi:hypothetical protein